MFGSDGHEGALTFLFGLIILVLLGVGVTLIADQKMWFGGLGVKMDAELQHRQEEIGHLRAKRDAALDKLRLSESAEKQHQEQFESIELQEYLAQDRCNRANIRMHELGDSIAQTREAFRQYRADLRKKVWAVSVGRHLGDLRLKSGSVYNNAKIMKVTEQGLDIVHKHGASTLPAGDLPSEYQERFQWEHLFLDRSQSADEGVKTLSSASPLAGNVIRRPEPNAASDRVSTARASFQAADRKLAAIREDYNHAASMSESSRSRSVPGSLGTWSDRVVQLKRDLSAAKVAYARARSELVSLSPSDPLLNSGQASFD